MILKRKKMEPERRAVWDLPPTAAGGRRREGEDAKNKKEISFPMEKTAKPLSLRPLLQFCKGGTA